MLIKVKQPDGTIREINLKDSDILEFADWWKLTPLSPQTDVDDAFYEANQIISETLANEYPKDLEDYGYAEWEYVEEDGIDYHDVFHDYFHEVINDWQTESRKNYFLEQLDYGYADLEYFKEDDEYVYFRAKRSEFR